MLMSTIPVATTRTTPWITGIIAVADRAHHQIADTRQGEDVLDDDRAADEIAELDADHGDEGNQRVAQDVTGNDLPLGQPLGAGDQDEFLRHRLQDARTQIARERAGEENPQRQRRQDHRLQTLDRILAQADIPLRTEPTEDGRRRHRRSTIASQNPGIDTPRKAQVVKPTSSQELRRSPAIVPAGTEIARAMRRLKIVRYRRDRAARDQSASRPAAGSGWSCRGPPEITRTATRQNPGGAVCRVPSDVAGRPRSRASRRDPE